MIHNLFNFLVNNSVHFIEQKSKNCQETFNPSVTIYTSQAQVYICWRVNNLAHFVPQKRNFFQRHLTPLKFLYVKIYVPRTPQKKFEANWSGGSLHFGSLLFSRFYLLKRWFLTFSEVKFWSFGGSNFGCETIQTSSHTYILKIWRSDPKNPSRFLLDPLMTDMFLR